jgi:hypothetical protein
MREITVEILVSNHATVWFVLCCHDPLKATVGTWWTAGEGMLKEASLLVYLKAIPG